MTGKQTAVMWLGLLLIITRLFTTGQWSHLWGSLTTNTAGGTGSASSGKSSGLFGHGTVSVPANTGFGGKSGITSVAPMAAPNPGVGNLL